jgi:hypothetical protein
VRAYKFLSEDGRGVFSGFDWPLPTGGPGAWVESDVAACRAGIHACRTADLPYWVAGRLYEIELDGAVDELPLKLVAPRGRLLGRIDAWDTPAREAYGQTCFARAHELAARAQGALDDWTPTPDISFGESARLGFIAALLAERLGGFDAHLEERRRQSDWLVEHLALR